MKIWRISNYADLSGRGGLLAEGRWHLRGTPVVYCADHPATAMLERLVHLDPEDLPASYKLLAIDVDDPTPMIRLSLDTLPDGWRMQPELTRVIGMDLLRSAEHLLICVPSVLVPQAWNVLLNPGHAMAQRCRIAETYVELFATRLMR